MQLIGRDEVLMDLLTGDLSIMSSKLYKLEIYNTDDSVTIDIYLELLYSKEKSHLKLSFRGVQEYSFYYTSNYIFYNVENYKFFKDKGQMYLSLDPFDEQESVSSEDQDFIFSQKVEGYLFSP